MPQRLTFPAPLRAPRPTGGLGQISDRFLLGDSGQLRPERGKTYPLFSTHPYSREEVEAVLLGGGWFNLPDTFFESRAVAAYAVEAQRALTLLMEVAK